jgi:excisionase family DNA binding protein
MGYCAGLRSALQSRTSASPVTFRIHPMELTDEILTIQEIAERLKVKKSTIYDLTRHRGRVRAETRCLPCIKVGRQLS